MNSKIILIANPVAGRHGMKPVEAAAGLFERAGAEVRLLLTAKRGDAERFAREAAESDAAFVAVSGGDGTYNEAANGLAYTGKPMAVLPSGTTSVLARELSMPMELEAAVRTAVKGRVQRVHLGKISLTKQNITRYFILMAGIGFDAEAVLGVTPNSKRMLGKTAYVLSGLKTVIRPNFAPFSLQADGLKRTGCFGAIIGKAARYGGDFTPTPGARLDEPYFEVLAPADVTRLGFVRTLFRALTGRSPRGEDLFRADRLLLEGDAGVQIDGDYFGTLPAEVEIAKDALLIIIP